MERETYINVEWWNPEVGAWFDLGEARNYDAALHRIAGLKAADSDHPDYRYRIVETTTTEV